LDLNPDKTPRNVYAKSQTSLPTSILDSNGRKVGEFLIRKYLCKEKLFGCTADDNLTPENIIGDKDILSKAVKGKGTTIKRTSKTKVREHKTERQTKEEKRKKEVASKLV
jgi:hypothetical protein